MKQNYVWPTLVSNLISPSGGLLSPIPVRKYLTLTLSVKLTNVNSV